MPVKGTYLAIAGVGAIFLWSGLKGKSWTSVLRNLISGQAPGAAITANTSSALEPTQTAAQFGGGAAYGYGAGVSASGVTTGQFSYSQLEQLWIQNGGSVSAAPMAAAIAMAESGGNASATDNDPNGTVDRGLWQINSVNGALSTYDTNQNARAAIQLSDNGTNWNAWTTYTSGAYRKFLQLCNLQRESRSRPER
jgi:Lysozyme like domain